MIILIVFVLLWGLFYFLGNKQEKFVSENIYEEDIKILEIEEDTNTLDENTSEELEIEEVYSEEEIKVNEDSKVVAEPKKIEKSVSDIEIEDKLVSWGFTPSTDRKVDTIVLHSSYNALGGDEYDLDKLIQEYKEYGVAAHYLIDRKGDIYRLVKDRDIAYHAGVSEVPDGRIGVNNFSIGIEIINTKTDDYEENQYEAVNLLIKEIKKDYNIKYVLGHSEIAPDRKTDPWNIDWDKIER